MMIRTIEDNISHSSLTPRMVSISLDTPRTLPAAGLPPATVFRDRPRTSKDVLAIQALPVELLVDIFALVDQYECWGSWGCIRGRGTAKLMLVCRQWRDITVLTPQFWRNIDIDFAEPPAWIPMFLTRSSGCTIDVRIFYPTPRSPRPTAQSIEILYPHCSRIRSLSVNLAMHDFPLVRPLFARKLPSLECIDVIPVADGSTVGSSMWVDLGLSCHSQPKLRSLVARQVWIPPPVHTWATLRVLKLYSRPTTAAGPLPIRDMVSMLSESSNTLEELYLWLYGMAPSSLVDVSQDKKLAPESMTNMSRLRVFSSHGSYLFIVSLLRFLKLPDNISQVDIRTVQLSAEEPLVRSASHSLFPLHARSLLERPSDVTFRDSPNTNFSEFEIRNLPPSTPLSSADDRDPFFLSFQHPAQGLKALVEVLGWTSVHALTFAATLPPPAEADTYESAFSAFPYLEALTLRPRAGSLTGRADVFAALQPSARSARDLVCCPRLRVLRVHGACANADDAREVLRALETCASERKEAGAPIALLDVHVWLAQGDCEALGEEEWASEAVARLEGCVGELRCLFGSSRAPRCPTCAGC